MLKFDYPEDYTGTNLNHRIINEKRKVTDAVSRVITLDYGAFFVESLVLRNVATARPLIMGKDYACVELDSLATEKSGKQVSTAILVQNKQVTDIEVDYIFVGGQHLTGLHLIKELKAVYPNGLEPKYHWDSVLNKPEAFTPVAHQTHVKELYGFDGVNKSLTDMINALNFKEQRQVNHTFNSVMAKLTEMNQQLDQYIATTEADIAKAFQDYRVQDNEYIFTNTPENPAVKRGYGNWVMVRNTVLKGSNADNAYVVGNDSVIALGKDQIIKNCYVWKNQNNSKIPTYTISSPIHTGLPASQRHENQDIVVNIATTNLAAGSKLAWVIVDNTTGDYVLGNLLFTPITGEAILDAQGKAQVIIKFRPNTDTANLNRSYSFRLLRTANSVFNFTVIDSSLEKRIELAFTIDAQGQRPISRVEEGQDFYLQVKYIGKWVQGEIAYLDWTASGISVDRISNGTNAAPKALVVPSSPTETYLLRVLANSLTESKQSVLVYALKGIDEKINSVASYATVEVTDTSKFNYAAVTFNDTTLSKTNIARVDEDVNFEIVIETNLPNTELNIVYNATKSIKDFAGLLSTVTTNAQGKVVIKASTIADYLTNIGTQSLTVLVEHQSEVLGYNTLFINDTSTTPAYSIFFSRQNIAQVITEINEGEKFFVNIKVDGWKTGARAPSLEFNYTLDDVTDTPIEQLKSRIQSTFYSAMLFDQSSASYNEVTWVNGNTLRLEFTAVADKLVKGDTKFSMWAKQSNQDNFNQSASLSIRDTSIPTVVASWSSSATVLTPISSVDEMQPNGLNQRCYLWVDVDGDGASFGNITLASNSANGVDFATVFPRNIKLANGASRHILTVDAKADFVAEGNKTLYVLGTYKNSRNQDVELFRSSITLVDNSILTALDAKTSTSATSVVAASAFSEWVPFYAHLTYPAFAFDTQIEWRAVFTTNPSGAEQLSDVSGTIEVARNIAGSVLTLTPIKDRLRDGESIFTLYYRRKIKSNSQYITAEKSLAGIKILDDSLPMSVTLKAYTNAARTTEAPAFVNEGTRLYLRAVVSNPDRNYSICFGVADNVSRQHTIGGKVTNSLTTASVPSRLDIADRRIVAIVPATQGETSINVDAEMVVLNDRSTASSLESVMLEARVYDNSNNQYPINTSITFALAPVANAARVVGINDTSKTAIYTVTAPATTPEDTIFEMKLAISDGTVGDVFYPIWDSGTVAANRFEAMGIGEEQLLATTTGTLTWRFKIKGDYKTTGELKAVIGFMNKTVGQKVTTKSINVTDASLPPDIQAPVVNTTTPHGTPLTVITERATTDAIKIYAANGQFKAGDKVLVEYVSGRAKTAFDTTLFGEHTILAPVNGSSEFVVIPVKLLADRTTNTAAQNVLTIKVTHRASGVTKNISYNLDDTSKTPAIASARWVNATTGGVITRADEGDKIRLELTTTGGTHPFNLTLVNDGGRSVGRLDANSYGGVRTHNADNNVLKWDFTIKTDYETNTGNETMMKVKVTADAGSISQVYTLPIYDNSKSTSGNIVFHADNSTTAITQVEEGVPFGVQFILNEPDPDGRFRLLTTSSRASDGWKIDSTFNTNQFYIQGSYPHAYKLDRETTRNAVVNTTAQLVINAELWDVKNNRLLASKSLNLIDTSRPTIPASSIRITTQGGTAHASSLNEGITADVYVIASAFAGIDWTKETVRISLSSSYTVGATFTVNANNRQSDGSFRGSFAIPADELTATGTQTLTARMYNVYTAVPGKEYLRGSSANTNVVDTSPLPVITNVFISTSSNVANATPVTSLDEGATFYVHVQAIGLNAAGTAATIALTWTGTATAADFNKALPTSLNVNLTNATTREFKGMAGPYVIKEDSAEG